MSANVKLAETPMKVGARELRVSTINRTCSSGYAAGMRYAETMVFEMEPARILWQSEAAEWSLSEHARAVRALHETGDVPKEPDDDGTTSTRARG